MQVFFHHVGQIGSADFDKTVFPAVSSSLVSQSVPSDARDGLLSELGRLFPSNTFNCWGVPEGAHSVIKALKAGDAVLLVRGLSVEDSVPALCPVKLFPPVKLPALSQALWGDTKYSYIFFFDTERLTYTWPEMTQDLGYADNWNPAGNFNRITSERLTSFGGAAGYVEHLRRLYRVLPDPFMPITSAEAATEPNLLFQDLDVASVDAALNELGQEAQAAGGDPDLTQPAPKQPHQVLARDAAFGIGVKRIYGYRCAICGAGARGRHQETELDTAHIYPKRKQGSDDLRNGLCLCKRHHWAYDVGWFVVSDDFTIQVHPSLPPDPDYTFISQWQGQKVALPTNQAYWPHPKFLSAQRNLSLVKPPPILEAIPEREAIGVG